jgi:hypothetical protein
MSGGWTDLRGERGPRRRWTLGGFMILIAIVAWPLALFARRPRPVDYPERALWQALSERRIEGSQAGATRTRGAALRARGRAPASKDGGATR